LRGRIQGQESDRQIAKVLGTAKTNSVGMQFAAIPAGEFTMGSPASEAGRSNDETQHHVRISKPFLMATTMVTQGQWQKVMGNNPSNFKGDDNLPVETVTWDDAVDFCKKLSEKEGLKYRLPTEAEWEYACRAGTTTEYNTGDGEDALKEGGWYSGNSDQKTHPVGQKKPNAWGLYDMHGNVWQWCSDWYGDYPGADASDPQGVDNGSARVLRGGCWFNNPDCCRAAFRYWLHPDDRFIYNGFRVVVVNQEEFGIELQSR